jgi:glycosyltransferase involved in cell wall biosynthesis
MIAQRKPGLLVLASTYPRWAGDSEPGFVHELARRLTGCFDVRVITPHSPGASRRERLDGVDIVRYRYAPASLETLVYGGGILTHLRRTPWKLLLLPGFVLGQWLAARAAIKQQRPAMIHAHWLLPQGMVARALAKDGVPYVVTSHGADLFALRGGLIARLRRWVVAKAAATTVVSHAMQELLKVESPAASVRVAPMGVDAQQRFTPDSSVIRSQVELLFVGRLVEKKGLSHLIEALPRIITNHPTVHLIVAGFGPEQDALQQRVQSLGIAERVNFLGAVAPTELPALYRRASLFVAPFVRARNGDQEGLGLVVAEAMACGCPVLAGNVEGVRDLVGNGAGVQVDATDHAALAKAVVELLGDRERRAQLAEAGRAHVLQHYAWEAVAETYRHLFETLIEGAP